MLMHSRTVNSWVLFSGGGFSIVFDTLLSPAFIKLAFLSEKPFSLSVALSGL